MSVTMTKVPKAMESIAAGGINLFTGSSDVFKIALVNDTPAAMKGYADLTNEAAHTATNGYTTGGNTAAFSTGAVTAGTLKLVLTSPATWTCGGSAQTIGPFQYAVLYDSTPAAKPLIGMFDYGSSITLAVGETFTVTLDAINGVLTIA